MNNSFYVLLGLSLLIGFSESLFHAECSVKWTLTGSCGRMQAQIVDQMNAWDNEDCGTKPGDTEPNGQKCLYHFISNDGLSTNGTHTTPIHRYVDNLLFKFTPKPLGYFGCVVDAYSQSTPESILDYGTNYCNLFNLMDGSGLTQVSDFTEETNDSICTQRSIADCDKF